MAMLLKPDFFQAQINECKHLAKHSENRNDREFWLKMAQRWEGLLDDLRALPPLKGHKNTDFRARDL